MRAAGRCDDGDDPELRALVEPPLGLRGLAQAAGEPDLAEGREPSRTGARARPRRSRARPRGRHQARRCARRPRRSRRRPRSPSAHARVPTEHGDDHREPLRIDAGADAARHREIGRQRRAPGSRAGAAACPRARSATAAPTSPASRRAEELRRVGHADEAGGGHLEDAELVRRAEAVLRRAQDAVLVVAVALELEDAVDEVLEHARPGDRAVLRHVADEDAWRRPPPSRRGAAAPAASRTCATEPGAEPSADACSVCTESITQTSGRSASSVAQTDVELRLGEDLDRLGAARARRAQRYLRGGLLAGDEQARRPLRAIAPERGEQEASTSRPRARRRRGRASPGTRPPPSTRSSSATRPSRCAPPPRPARPDRDGLRRRRRRARRGRAVELFDEAAERAAARALAEPAARHRAAFGARELNGDLRHRVQSRSAVRRRPSQSAPFACKVGARVR